VTITVRLPDVTIDPKIQLKARGVDNDTVAAYVEAITNGAEFPPIVVFDDGETLRLADGFHRVSAARFLGLADVEAEVNRGSREEAMIYAATANVTNGRPMSQKQKREAGERLIGLTDWSDSEIARQLAVAHTTVMRWREKLSCAFAQDTPATRIVTRGNTTYQIDVSNIGRKNGPAQRALPDQLQIIDEAMGTAQIAGEAPAINLTGLVDLICGDFNEVAFGLEPGSIDVIITDPPYSREYLYLYEALAEQAARLLKPGGSLLAMAGQSYLPEVFALLTPHIKYHWIVAYLTPGGRSPQIWPRKVNTFWKPVLWFTNGEYTGQWVGDVARSAVNDNDKRFHDWGQSESGMADLIERFSVQGDLILDPFCGGGTTGVVALALNRRFVGVDVDERAIEETRRRLEHGHK
jgi:SAM-dependent methyltransferase